MKLSKLKIQLAKSFKQKKIDSNEVNILICEALGVKFEDLFKIESLTSNQVKKIKYYANQRLSGKPIQKIFKRAYFFDFVFYVNNNVLCPRPETELLVEEVLKNIKPNKSILDLCIGSGCIAITVSKKSNANVFASDISQKALYVAKKNAKNIGADVKFIKSNMFENIHQKFDIIVSNPPYISTADCQNLDTEVKNYDPIISLDGGSDGLDFYRIISQRAKYFLNENGKILLEVGQNQAKKVAKLLQNDFIVTIKKDYNHIERIVIGELKWLKDVTK